MASNSKKQRRQEAASSDSRSEFSSENKWRQPSFWMSDKSDGTVAIKSALVSIATVSNLQHITNISITATISNQTYQNRLGIKTKYEYKR